MSITLIPGLLTILFTVIVTFLLTFFLASISAKKAFEDMLNKGIKQHSVIYHKDTKPMKEYILEHEKNCLVGEDVKNIKIGIAFIVGKFDGDPHKMGLL